MGMGETTWTTAGHSFKHRWEICMNRTRVARDEIALVLVQAKTESRTSNGGVLMKG